MAEMPGMIRPDLQALPQVRDRMTFLYLELAQACGQMLDGTFPRTCGGDPHSDPAITLLYAFPRMCGGCEKESRAVPLRMLFVGCRSFAGRPSDAGWAERFLSFR